MPTRQATAIWTGSIKNGQGRVSLGSGAIEADYSFNSRFEDGQGTNPEELAGAAQAGCFAMALSKQLGDAGYEPKQLKATAKVSLGKADDGFAIQQIDLSLDADVPGIDDAEFQKLARAAKMGCPISKLFQGAAINLNARLASA